MLVFGSEELLQRAAPNGNQSCDGMFGSVPTIFGQLFTIHAIINRIFTPVVYAILPNKMESTYRSLLKVLLDIEVFSTYTQLING